MFTLASSLSYVDQTTMTPLAAGIVALFCGVTWVGTRPQALAAMLGVICFIPTAQRIAILGFDFDPLRLLIISGFIRVIVRSELLSVATRPIDYVFAVYTIVAWLSYCVLFGFAPSAVIYRCGELFTIIGIYILCRCFLRSRDDVQRLAFILAILAMIVCGFFLIEWSTGRNMFSVFGRVRWITVIREGRLRCQGAFPHPILAGCFWAGVLPIAAILYWSTDRKPLLACAGSIAALVIVITCSSSTPAMMIVVIAMLAIVYPVRGLLPMFLLMFAGVALLRWIVNGNPPWHLIARIDLVGGSTGWQRYHLIDQAIWRFPEWCLIGTRSTAHWGWGLRDVTNQYILEGVRGGFLSMALFCLILGLAFRHLAIGPGGDPHDRQTSAIRWCLVCALAGHAAAFFAVSYFGAVQAIYWSTVAAAIAIETDQPADWYIVIDRDESDEQ